MNATVREIEELKTKIHSFRVSDLQSLVASFGRSRNGKKQDLQNRAFEILRTQPPDVDMLAFKRKIYELFRIAQDEAKQTHYDFQPQQRVMNQPLNAHMTPGPYTLPPQTRPSGNTIVYQNGGIVSGNGYPNTNVYPGQVTAPSIQPPSIIASNLGDTVRIISPPTPISYTSIKFKSLPFYRVKHEILKPTILKMKANGRNNATQVFQVSFVLTCDMASDVALHRDYTKNEFVVQAQLRICAIDSSDNQTAEYDDLLPLGLYVRMNDKQCALPPCSPCVRPNVEARRVPLPINITQFLKLSPMNVNKLTINWTPEVGRTFVACVNVVEKLSSSYLLNRLKEKPAITEDITKGIITKQYKRVIDDDDDNEDADDDDIATTIVRVSLHCPLAKYRIMHPAKGKNCGHLQCFDGFAYISCNEKKPVWACPVCNRSLHYNDLLIDQYFVDVLASEESADCQEVQLFVDGSWKVYEEDVTDLTEKDKPRNSAPNSPCENTSLASPAELFTQDGEQKHSVSDNAVSTSGISPSIPDSFVDLTTDDEDMDKAQSEMRISVEAGEEFTSNGRDNDVTAIAFESSVGVDVPLEKSLSPPHKLTQSVVCSTAATSASSPATSPVPDLAQPTSSWPTSIISPASLSRSSCTSPEINTNDEDGLPPDLLEDTTVPSPSSIVNEPSNSIISSLHSVNSFSNPDVEMSESIHQSVSPLLSQSNSNILPPQIPPLCEIDNDETNKDLIDILSVPSHNQDTSLEKICGDTTMTSVPSEQGVGFCESAKSSVVDALPTVLILSPDLDESAPMEEGLVENINILNTPVKDTTANESPTPAGSLWENLPNPIPSEMARLNLGD